MTSSNAVITTSYNIITDIPTSDDVMTVIPTPNNNNIINIPYDLNEEDLDKILIEEFDKLLNSNDQNKVIILNTSKLNFNSILDNDQYIQPIGNSVVNFNGGNLNLILPDSSDVTVILNDDVANLSINGEGDIKISTRNLESSSVNITSNSQISGQVSIELAENIESLFFESIEYKDEGSITIKNSNNEKNANFVVKNVSVLQNANAKINNATILNSLSIDQSSSLDLHNVSFESAMVIIDISFSNNAISPYLTGTFNNPPINIRINKISQSDPNKNANYVLILGRFEERKCEEWIEKLNMEIQISIIWLVKIMMKQNYSLLKIKELFLNMLLRKIN